jgi:fatty acid desaturase
MMEDDPFERAVERERDEHRRRRHRAARTAFRLHATTFVAVNLMLVALWALARWMEAGTDHPWFVYPLLGWGVALVVHYVVVRPAYRSRGGVAADGHGEGRS